MVIVTTPGGSRKVKRKVEENRSTILGAAANLSNDILGAGIAGVPFAVAQCGLVAGIFMILASAAFTDKTLRILVETAKFAKVPSYETLAEASFGRKGFPFIAINMFIFSYGSMVGYLMMVKETLPYCFGIVESNHRRLFLFIVSLCVMVPISSQRDMADLSKTSRLNVVFCTIIALIVAYLAPVADSVAENGGIVNVVGSSVLNFSTVFAGIGIFSYSYLVQHSAFIIAGSLHNPTRKRWAKVTFRTNVLCAVVFSICAGSGYLAFMGKTSGNILDNFNPHNPLANLARGLLGTVMLFIYPIEAFVSRHVCVVIFFTGQDAHDGDDTAVLNRADRRIGLTVAIYILAVIPAIIFTNLGPVLSLTGTLGGSCLSYMGPGAVYLAIHGNRFMEMANHFFNIDTPSSRRSHRPTSNNPERQPLSLDTEDQRANLFRKRGTNSGTNTATTTTPPADEEDSSFVRFLKCILWYVLLMPIWYQIALSGSMGYEKFKQEEAMKEKRISRIDSMRDVPAAQSPAVNPLTAKNRVMSSDGMARSAGSFGSYGTLISPKVAATTYYKPTKVFTGNFKTPEIIEQERQKKERESKPKEAPQSAPTVYDFVVAALFIIYGAICLFAGLSSLYVEVFAPK